jgi:hypothetical protein
MKKSGKMTTMRNQVASVPLRLEKIPWKLKWGNKKISIKSIGVA